jgi:NitT/TauT family transport system permease protein
MQGRAYQVLSISSPLLFLLAWELLVRTGVLDERYVPPPTRVLQVLGELLASGELLVHLGASLRRIMLGFLLGAGLGVVLGLLMGWFKWIRVFFKPIIAITFPIPKIALLPLLLILFGIGETSKVVLVAIPVFFLVLITTMDGVLEIDPVLIQAGQNYGATGWKLFLNVILPASLPAIFTGLRLALGVSLLVIVAAEFVAAHEGLGQLIWTSWTTLAVGNMYAGLVVIAALGLLFSSGLEYVERMIMPWANKR